MAFEMAFLYLQKYLKFFPADALLFVWKFTLFPLLLFVLLADL